MDSSQLGGWLRQKFRRWSGLEPPEGQGLVEYALILVLVVLVVLVVVAWLGPWIGNVFSNLIYTI